MKRSRTARAAVGAVTVTLVAVLGGCGGDGGGGGDDSSPTPDDTSRTGGASPSPTGSPSQAADQATVKLSSKDDDLGRYLTDAEGRTLYLFVSDSSGKSTCYDACADAWPPLLTSGEPRVGKDAKSDLVGTMERKNGKTQVTYDGHPLYYYDGDDEPGDTDGQGISQFGAKWFVLDASGNKITQQGQDGQDGQDDQDQNQDQDGNEDQDDDTSPTPGDEPGQGRY